MDNRAHKSGMNIIKAGFIFLIIIPLAISMLSILTGIMPMLHAAGLGLIVGLVLTS